MVSDVNLWNLWYYLRNLSDVQKILIFRFLIFFIILEHWNKMKFAASLIGELWEGGGETEITKWLSIVTIIFCDLFIYSLHITYSKFFVNRMSNFWFFFLSSDKIRFVFKSCHLTPAIYGKGLTLWHFQNVKEIKTSEIFREILERFQVLRAFLEVFDFRFSVDLFRI